MVAAELPGVEAVGDRVAQRRASSPVITAITPGSARASPASIPRIRAWGWGSQHDPVRHPREREIGGVARPPTGDDVAVMQWSALHGAASGWPPCGSSISA